MRAYTIYVNKVEELQTLSDVHELEKIFERAKSTIVNGERVLLARKDKDGKAQAFDEMDTLEDLELYRKTVFRYL